MTAGRFCFCPSTNMFLRKIVRKSRILLVNDNFIGFNLLYSQSFYIFASHFSTDFRIDESKDIQKEEYERRELSTTTLNTINTKKDD